FEHVLKAGDGALIESSSGARSGMSVPVVLNCCTFGSSGPLVRFRDPSRIRQGGRLSIQGVDSIIAPASGGIFEFAPGSLPGGWHRYIESLSQGLIAPNGVWLVAQSGGGSKWTEVDSSLV